MSVNKSHVFHFVVMSPEKKVLDKKVNRVTFPGDDGSFQVLYNHAPLIASLKAGEIRYLIGDEEECVAIENGFVEVRDNEVSAAVELAEEKV